MTAIAVYTGARRNQKDAEDLVIATRVQLKQIHSSSDPKLDQFKHSLRYTDPVVAGFPLLNSEVNRLAASRAPLASCMSSNTAATFGINTTEPWLIQVGTKIQVDQEVSEFFMQNLHISRRTRAANPFVAIRYQGTHDAGPSSAGLVDPGI